MKTVTSNHQATRAGRHCGVSLAFVAFALAAFFMPGWGEALQLDRNGLAEGKLWQLITGHFTHWNADHLLWDLITFAVLAVFCESRSRTRFLACVSVSTLAISLGFLFIETDLSTYRGLSGIDSALYGLAMIELLRERRLLAILGITGFLLKTIVEVSTGTTTFVASSADAFLPVPSAHLIGFVCGIASILFLKAKNSADSKVSFSPSAV